MINLIKKNILSGTFSFAVFSTLCALTLLTVLYHLDQNLNLNFMQSKAVELSFEQFVSITLLGPFVETILLVFILFIIQLFFENNKLAFSIALITFIILHSQEFWAWGIIIAPLFTCKILAFFFWQHDSTLKAFLAPFLVHYFHNTFSFMVFYWVWA